jgi:predicted ATPase
VTGGPGGGKTTAVDFFRREIGEQIVIVPEAATMIFSGGFPREPGEQARMAAQKAVYHVQRNLEDVQAALYPERVLLCDRGTVDGAVYWPGGPEGFFEALETSLETELERYDAVIFFESAAVGGMGIEGGNPIRSETMNEAVELNSRLRSIWAQHPHFMVVDHDPSFFKKIGRGLDALSETICKLSP